MLYIVWSASRTHITYNHQSVWGLNFNLFYDNWFAKYTFEVFNSFLGLLHTNLRRRTLHVPYSIEMHFPFAVQIQWRIYGVETVSRALLLHTTPPHWKCAHKKCTEINSSFSNGLCIMSMHRNPNDWHTCNSVSGLMCDVCGCECVCVCLNVNGDVLRAYMISVEMAQRRTWCWALD